MEIRTPKRKLNYLAKGLFMQVERSESVMQDPCFTGVTALLEEYFSLPRLSVFSLPYRLVDVDGMSRDANVRSVTEVSYCQDS